MPYALRRGVLLLWALASGIAGTWIYLGAGYETDPLHGRESIQVRNTTTQKTTMPDGSCQEVTQVQEQTVQQFPAESGREKMRHLMDLH